MTRSITFGLGSIAVIFMMSGIAHATDKDGLRGIVGDWGCSFNTPVGPVDDVGGVIVASIDRQGIVTGSESIAVANPSLYQLGLPLSGNIVHQPDGTFLLTITVDVGGGPEQTEAVCVGMDRIRDQFREFRCVDFTEESGEEDGVNSLSFVTCKRR